MIIFIVRTFPTLFSEAKVASKNGMVRCWLLHARSSKAKNILLEEDVHTIKQQPVILPSLLYNIKAPARGVCGSHFPCATTAVPSASSSKEISSQSLHLSLSPR
jgi:hypothetical protein